MATEFPKTMYRYDEEGERVGKTFASPDLVEEGWVSFDDLGPPPARKPKPPMPSAEAVDAGKRIAGLEGENKRLRDTVKALEEEIAAVKRAAKADAAGDAPQSGKKAARAKA